MAKIVIIETGGKQYVVTQESVLNVDPIRPRRDVGANGAGKIIFDKVLLIDDGTEAKVGTPYISGAKVSAELVQEGRDAKVRVIHYRPKSRHFKKAGHRQPYAKVRITALP